MNDSDQHFVEQICKVFDSTGRIPGFMAEQSYLVIDIIGVCGAIKDYSSDAYDALHLARRAHPPETATDRAKAEAKANADPETAAALEQLLAEEPGVQRGTPGDDDQAAGKKSQASMLVELALEDYYLGVCDTGEVFAVEMAGPNIALKLRGGRTSLGSSLASRFFARHGRVPTASARADALAVLEGMAQSEDPVELPLRVARDGRQRIILDLGTPEGGAVVISTEGWEIVDRSPVRFARTNLTCPLPMPDDGMTGNDGHDGHDGQMLPKLRDLLNVKERDWALVLGWLVAAMIPDIPHPILALFGEQGVGKSVMGWMLGLVMDPSSAPLRSAPRNEDSWAIGAAGSFVVVLDNLSSVQPWLSDALCRAVTGDALVRRQLYTDSDVNVLRFRRAVIMTSIDAGALRGDLAERLVPVELELIDTAHRRTEADLMARFTEVHPQILGELLDLVVKVQAALPTVHLDDLPRMADFAKVLAAVDSILGTNALATYLNLGNELADDVIESDPVASAIVTLVNDRTSWTGSALQLLKEITPTTTLPKDWPTQASDLGGRLKRAATALRSAGITVEYKRTAAGRLWTIERTEVARICPSSPTWPSSSAPTLDGIDDGSTASPVIDDSEADMDAAIRAAL